MNTTLRRHSAAAILAACLATPIAALAVAPVATTDAGASAEVLRHETPRVEIVFVLDTTGSMSGLIQGAKDTIWAITNRIAAADPAPEIHLGLVAYRDRGDAYVTKVTPLTTDLDAVYAELMSLTAQGGGDHPESVNLALHQATTTMAWSTDKETYRTIFLVGDAPAQSYPDEPSHPEICNLALSRDIVINTVQCGAHGDTTTLWQTIAKAGEGRSFQVEQSGGVQVADTPYDEELARLSTELDATTMYYGAAPVQSAMRERKDRAAAVSATSSDYAKAERASFQATESGAVNLLGSNELVEAVAKGDVDLAAMPEAELPAELQAVEAGQRAKVVEEKAQKREEIRAQITTLTQQRQQFIKDESSKQAAAGGGAATAFDTAVAETLREQGARKGLNFAE